MEVLILGAICLYSVSACIRVAWEGIYYTAYQLNIAVIGHALWCDPVSSWCYVG